MGTLIVEELSPLYKSLKASISANVFLSHCMYSETISSKVFMIFFFLKDNQCFENVNDNQTIYR